MSNLEVYKKNEIEIVIDQETGEAFSTIRGYARMSGVLVDTVAKRVKRGSKGVDISSVKSAEIQTAKGLQSVYLIPANTVYDWLLDDNRDLAKKMGIAGATVFMHKLAGFTPIAPAAPQTYLEALKALVAQEEAKQLLKAEKQLLESENRQLSEAVDELFDYSSIIRVAKFNKVSEKAFSWRTLKAYCTKANLQIKQVPCPRYQVKNLYPHEAWRYCYPRVKLPETTTLAFTGPGLTSS